MRLINHTVWASPVPPVSTFYWTQKSWDRWNFAYRPTHYHGGAYSSWDWLLYKMHLVNQMNIETYMSYELFKEEARRTIAAAKVELRKLDSTKPILS